MLRMTVAWHREAVYLRLEGKLTGPWVEELAGVWTRLRSTAVRSRLIVELSGVTFVSAEGRALLTQLAECGTELRADDVMNRSTVEDIRNGLAADHRT